MESTIEQNRNHKKNPQQLLLEGKSIQIRPVGYSMYPFICPKQDWVIISGAEKNKVRQGDVVLYRRTQGILVLHRVFLVKQEGIYLVGDNQTQIEGPIEAECILGKMTAVIKGNRRLSVKNPFYCLAARLWLWLRPVRPCISHTAACIKRYICRH